MKGGDIKDWGTVTVRGIELPLLQALAIADRSRSMIHDGKEPTWHRNECECCVTVHENVEHPTGGYLIGSDGEYSWIDV